MLFDSIQFLIFMPIVSILYFVIPHKFRWIWLLFSSYFFYMSWDYKYGFAIGIITVINYIFGRLIEGTDLLRNKTKALKLRKIILFISILSGLGILISLKYFNFFEIVLINLLAMFRIFVKIPSSDFVGPIGLSFYILQTISYTIDIYRRDIPAEKNFCKYALYISFFPKLIAGPIEKAKNMLLQFEEKHYFDYDRIKNGLLLILWGLFQKIVVADRLSILVDTVYKNPSAFKGIGVMLATIFYSFQIYCDFSGYSDIAIGVAQIMGFKLSQNFNKPYFSKSIKEFWRRWHITLGSWFKDYVYIPLGGNRCSKLRNYFNLAVVFILCGLWHGFSITFLIWGALHGIYQVLGEVLKPLKKLWARVFSVKEELFSHKLFKVCVTFLLVNFAWIFFRATSFTNAIDIISNMFYINPWALTDGSIYKLGLSQADFDLSIISIFFIIFIDLLRRKRNLISELSKQSIFFRWSLYIVGIFIIVILGIYGPDYNIQKFIYSKF